MNANYPTINQAPMILRSADANGVLDEPHSEEIADSGGYSEPVGFAGTPFNVEVKPLDDAAADDAVEIEICNEPTFAVPSVHPDSPQSIGDLLTGNIIQFGLEGAPGYWRVKNTGSVAVQVSAWRLPNRR